MQLNSCNLFLISKNHQALSLSLNNKMRLQTIGKYKIHGKGSIYESYLGSWIISWKFFDTGQSSSTFRGPEFPVRS